jgi:predicted PurR-regulated permease PerM
VIFLNLIPENIIRPRLAMKSAAIHPIITLLAFAAPLFVVGMVGIVVGPALYGFLLAAYRTRIRLIEAAGVDDAEAEDT